jgi:hypothetical protein
MKAIQDEAEEGDRPRMKKVAIDIVAFHGRLRLATSGLARESSW